MSSRRRVTANERPAGRRRLQLQLLAQLSSPRSPLAPARAIRGFGSRPAYKRTATWGRGWQEAGSPKRTFWRGALGLLRAT